MPYNPYNPYNPYAPQPAFGGFPNPYAPQQQAQPQPQAQPQLNTYAFVNGIEGAKSFPMQPNQTVMLMDSENPVAYMKQSNGMGQATLKYFRLVETSEAELRGQAAKPSVEYAMKADLDALAKRVDEMAKPIKKSRLEE